MIDKSLGPYRVSALLGAGGMGEVYRAMDTKLGREVAIKVLPQEVAGDAQRLARFRREAQVLASLNHPNIAAIHGLEEAEGRPFLVLELVEGEDLAARIARQRVPVDEALAIVLQIADALEEAHAKGIVHRDLKPANVKLTPAGKVKVLDFGLAKAYAGEAAIGTTADPRLSPTLSRHVTEAGLVLGTAAYMSPEQARGRPVDKRADIWALGVVLWEMLTGSPLFTGDTLSDVLAAVLTREPDWASLSNLGPALTIALKRCLSKDPRRRWHCAADFAQALDDASMPAAHARVGLGLVAASWKRVALVSIAIAVTAVVAAAIVFFGAPPTAGPVAAAPAWTFRPLTQGAGLEVQPTISPDGRLVAYASNADGDWDIYLVRVGGGNPINLTANSPDDDYHPAFSPDGERIAFRSERDGGGTFLMGATGESPRRVSNAGFNASWSPDGTRLVVASEGIRESFGRETSSPLLVVDIATGSVREIGGDDAVQPAWSPQGHRIAFWGLWPIGSGRPDLWTIAPDGSGKVRVTDDVSFDTSPAWSPDGRFLWFASDRGGSLNLWRVAIDEVTGAVLSEPEPVTVPSGWAGQLSLSADGRGFVFTALDRRNNLERIAFDPNRGLVTGAPVALTRGSRIFSSLSPSPDSRWIALSSFGTPDGVFLMPRDGGEIRQIVEGDSKQVMWRPDGRQITFLSDRGGTAQIWSVRPDGSALTQLTNAEKGAALPIWSPDGKRLIAGWDEPSTFDATAGPPLTIVSPLPRPPSDGTFWPSSWSPDGQTLVGYVNLKEGLYARGVQLLSVDSGSYRTVAAALTHPIAGSPPMSSWLRDSRRLLHAGPAGIYLIDAIADQTRLIWPAPPGTQLQQPIAASADREIYFLHGEQEADIWVASLARGARGFQ
ncbi:MAG: protein kinase domain-containing protein [Acidobacteriota bacterium]